MGGLEVSVKQAAPIPLDAEFGCARGELIALVGPSGSGKSSLLRVIAGLAGCASGRVTVGSAVWFDAARGIALKPQERRVGLVFQDYALFPHLSARDNIAAASSRDDPLAHADELLAKVKLEGLGDRRPAALSGGQQQRVALARALAREPAVLLLDEPFSAIDQVTRQDLYVEIAALRRSLAVPIVLVTHDLLEAQRLADRIVILDAGTTLQAGSPQQVQTRPRNARVARLLGLHNHFPGVFHAAPAGESWGQLSWGDGSEANAIELRVKDKRRIDDGARVSWVVPGDCVSLAFEATPAGWPATLVQRVPLGEVTQCVVELSQAPWARVTVTLSSRQARLHDATEGMTLWLLMDVEGIHIMPRRTGEIVGTRVRGQAGGSIAID
ncbi:MAG: ABC transporter ATP-binding protein [Burkholderiaceae bacterium]